MNRNLLEKLQERSENMRLKPTYHEGAFKKMLEEKQINFQTQYIIGMYIVDFIVGNTVIELDGDSHDTERNQAWDVNRDCYLKSRGFKIIRIQNKDINNFNFTKLKEKTQKNPSKEILKRISSKDGIFKTLNWNKQRIILQRERLYGA